MNEILKSSAGRPIEDIVVRQNLKHTKRYAKVSNKLTEVFDFWMGIVEAKSKDYTKVVSIPKKYQVARQKAFGTKVLPKPRVHNKYLANMEALYGEILDKYEELSTTKKKRVLRVKHPIKLIAKLTNLKFEEVFPNEEDNLDFQSILITTSFSRDEVIKR